MARGPAVLLLDDGELDDVQRILEKQRVGFARIRGGAIVSNTAAPERLLIATPHKRPHVAASTGWEMLGEVVRARVRVRLYSSTERAT